MTYPYRNLPIRLRWREPNRQPVLLGALLCGLLGAGYLPFDLASRPDAWALHLMLPLALSGLLLAAPEPVSAGGRLSRDLLALATAASTLLPGWQGPMILATPLFLAIGTFYQHYRESRHGLLY